MILALLIVGVAFAAFCVWLPVRIINRRERWAKSTLGAIVGLPLLYIASFGPACGLLAHRRLDATFVESAFWPVLWAYCDTPFGVMGSIRSYAETWMPEGSRITLEHQSLDGAWYSCAFFGR